MIIKEVITAGAPDEVADIHLSSDATLLAVGTQGNAIVAWFDEPNMSRRNEKAARFVTVFTGDDPPASNIWSYFDTVTNEFGFVHHVYRADEVYAEEGSTL